jgi:hypothetical protein
MTIKRIVNHFIQRVVRDKRGVAPIVAGAGLGALAGGIFGRRDDRRTSTLSPAQRQVQADVGARLRTLLRQPTSFGGQVNAPLGQAELAAIERSQRLSRLGEESLGRIIPGAGPEFDEQFQREIVRPSVDTFRSEIQPLLEEALPSFSTARGQVLSRNLGQLQRDLLTQRFGAREAARERSLRGIDTARS